MSQQADPQREDLAGLCRENGKTMKPAEGASDTSNQKAALDKYTRSNQVRSNQIKSNQAA